MFSCSRESFPRWYLHQASIIRDEQDEGPLNYSFQAFRTSYPGHYIETKSHPTITYFWVTFWSVWNSEKKDILTMWLYSPVGRLHEVLTRRRGGFKIIVWFGTTGTILKIFVSFIKSLKLLTLPDGAVRAWAMPGEGLGGLPGQCTIRPPPPVIVSRPPSPPSPMVSDDSESLRQIHKGRSFMACSSVSLEMR